MSSKGKQGGDKEAPTVNQAAGSGEAAGLAQPATLAALESKSIRVMKDAS